MVKSIHFGLERTPRIGGRLRWDLSTVATSSTSSIWWLSPLNYSSYVEVFSQPPCLDTGPLQTQFSRLWFPYIWFLYLSYLSVKLYMCTLYNHCNNSTWACQCINMILNHSNMPDSKHGQPDRRVGSKYLSFYRQCFQLLTQTSVLRAFSCITQPTDPENTGPELSHRNVYTIWTIRVSSCCWVQFP